MRRLACWCCPVLRVHAAVSAASGVGPCVCVARCALSRCCVVGASARCVWDLPMFVMGFARMFPDFPVFPAVPEVPRQVDGLKSFSP